MEEDAQIKIRARLRLTLPILVFVIMLGATFLVWLYVKDDIDNCAPVLGRAFSSIIIMGGLLAFALFIVVYFLVTARQKAVVRADKITKDLRKSEKRFRDLADLLPANVFESDVTGKTTFVNQYAFKSLGYTEAHVKKGVNVLDIAVPEERKRVVNELQQILNGKTITVEYTLLRADGSEYPVILYASPIIENGKVVGARGVSFDISERKKVEEELKSRAMELEQINKLMVGRELKMIELKE